MTDEKKRRRKEEKKKTLDRITLCKREEKDTSRDKTFNRKKDHD